MKKYKISTDLQKFIDWENIMKMPRYAGGHDEQMIDLFKDSELVAHWNDGDYQGSVATCVKMPDNTYVIYNDYYGSCSGCDAWEDASDEEVKNMCINLSNGAYIFQSLDDVIEFLQTGTEEDNLNWFSSWDNIGKNLLKEIIRNKE